MSGDVYDLLDELAARGRRLRGQLPGDYKPVTVGGLVGDVWAHLYPLILSSSVTEADIPSERE
jgi:hypothetical protein